MNLYLISQDKNDYDTYDSAVVAAMTEEEEARSIHPSDEIWNGRTEGNRYTWTDTSWCNREDVKVKLIGKAEEGIHGVICASFNAS